MSAGPSTRFPRRLGRRRHRAPVPRWPFSCRRPCAACPHSAVARAAATRARERAAARAGDGQPCRTWAAPRAGGLLEDNVERAASLAHTTAVSISNKGLLFRIGESALASEKAACAALAPDPLVFAFMEVRHRPPAAAARFVSWAPAADGALIAWLAHHQSACHGRQHAH